MLDPKVQTVIDRFVDHLEPPRPGQTNRSVLTHSDTGDDVGHLSVAFSPVSEPTPEDDFPFARIVLASLLSVFVDVYLSRDGLKLLELTESRKPQGNIAAIVFLEIGDDDRASGQVFELALHPDLHPRWEEFLAETALLSPVIRRELGGLSPDEYRQLVESRFEGAPSIFENLEDFLLEKTAEGIVALTGLLEKLAKVVGDDFKMPAELWHPQQHPDDLQEFLDGLGTVVDTNVHGLLEKVQELRIGDLERFLPEVQGEKLLPRFVQDALHVSRTVLALIHAHYEGLLEVLRRVAAFVDQNRPDATDVVHTIIGYLCGVWDAIIDCVAGFVETLGLALELLGAYIEASKDLRTTLQVGLEALDQVIQALERIEWGEIWEHFEQRIFPKLIRFVEEKGEDLEHEIAKSPAAVGYYFGYLVYNVVESLFPPLKLTKAAKASRAASRTARYVDRILTS